MKKAVGVATTRVVALLLSAVLALSLSGCLSFVVLNAINDARQDPYREQPPVEARGVYNDLSYEELCAVLFEHEVSSDSLSLNQLVADPRALGLEVPRPATLGSYSYVATQEDNRFYSEMLEALSGGHTIDRAALEQSQQLEAEYLEKVLRQELRYEAYFYYLEPLSPSTGVQAWLPLSLMDYSFKTVDDVEIYLEILQDVPRYFAELLAVEDEKQAQMLLMPREALEDTIEEARAYTGEAETHILVTAFNEMLDTAVSDAAGADAAGEDDAASDTGSPEGLARLSSEQVQDYRQRNLSQVEEYVIPAYEQLVAGLTPLVSSCKEGTRLYDYAHGTEYYELVMESMGFAEGASSAARTLDTALEGYWSTIAASAAALSGEDMIPESVVQAIGDAPEDYLNYIQEHAGSEFASANELRYQIKEAPDASPNDYAMAYFLTPPVDDPQRNIIVYFPRNISDDVEFYGTMAHEGYPGHMYQAYAYSVTNPSNISKVLGSLAYMEGWAMYAEARAIRYLNTDASAVDAYNAYEKFLYGLQARVDIGINFEGWSVGDTERYLTTWGFEDSAESLYDVSVRQPVAYLPYGLGLIEFDMLRERAEAHLGRDFDPVLFHQHITSLGALPFDMLEREFEAWLRATDAQQT
ncbi:MAG: DUF885 domain-containing protein [Coriobacteriales bacterium]|jgi:uncharacterized protein (DUF885 family)|nr:DUF885 domain-containing protein [Coriobacteriales bacterium]